MKGFHEILWQKKKNGGRRSAKTRFLSWGFSHFHDFLIHLTKHFVCYLFKTIPFWVLPLNFRFCLLFFYNVINWIELNWIEFFLQFLITFVFSLLFLFLCSFFLSRKAYFTNFFYFSLFMAFFFFFLFFKKKN